MLKKILLRLVGWWQRTFLYRFRSVGRNVRLGRNLFISARRVSLGDDVYIGAGSYLDGDIEVGNGVMLANAVAIVGGDHVFDQPGKPMFAAPREHWRKTTIADDVWIGHGAIVINGITINRGALVAAGAVVTSDVPAYSIVVGNPARVLRHRFSESEIIEHEKRIAAFRRT